MSAEPNNKRPKVIDENRIHVIAKIKESHRQLILSELPKIQNCFDDDINELDKLNIQWHALNSADAIEKIEFFINYCYTLQDFRCDVQRVKQFIAITHDRIRAINDPNETTGMVKTVSLLTEMANELSDGISSAVYEKTPEFTALYNAAKENLNARGTAFMLPWLNPAHPDPITASIQALESFSNSDSDPVPVVDDESGYVSGTVLGVTQHPAP